MKDTNHTHIAGMPAATLAPAWADYTEQADLENETPDAICEHICTGLFDHEDEEVGYGNHPDAWGYARFAKLRGVMIETTDAVFYVAASDLVGADIDAIERNASLALFGTEAG